MNRLREAVLFFSRIDIFSHFLTEVLPVKPITDHGSLCPQYGQYWKESSADTPSATE